MITASYNDVLFRAAELAGRTRDKIPVSEATMLQGFLAVALQRVWTIALWPELIPDPLAVTVSANRQFSKNEGNSVNGQISKPVTFSPVNVTSANGSTATLTMGASTYPVGQVLQNCVITGALNQPIFNGSFTLTVASNNGVTTTMTYTLVPPPGGIIPVPPFSDTNLTVVVPVEIGDVFGVYSADPSQTTRYHDVEFEEANGYVRIYETLASVFVDYLLPRPDLMLVPAASLATYPIASRFSNTLALRAAGLLLQSDGLGNQSATYLGLSESVLSNEETRVKPASWRTAPRTRNFVMKTAQ